MSAISLVIFIAVFFVAFFLIFMSLGKQDYEKWSESHEKNRH